MLCRCASTPPTPGRAHRVLRCRGTGRRLRVRSASTYPQGSRWAADWRSAAGSRRLPTGGPLAAVCCGPSTTRTVPPHSRRSHGLLRIACPAHTLEVESVQRAWPASVAWRRGQLSTAQSTRGIRACRCERRRCAAALVRSLTEIARVGLRSCAYSRLRPASRRSAPVRKSTGIASIPGTVRSVAYRQRDGTTATPRDPTRRTPSPHLRS